MTCVDLVENCKKATFIDFLSRKKVKFKQRKHNAIYLSCSIALIIIYVHKIEQMSIGAISVGCSSRFNQNRLRMLTLFWRIIHQNSVSMRSLF